VKQRRRSASSASIAAGDAGRTSGEAERDA
jgi:hypothetical protein